MPKNWSYPSTTNVAPAIVGVSANNVPCYGRPARLKPAAANRAPSAYRYQDARRGSRPANSLAARFLVLDILKTELVDNDIHQIQHSHKLVVAKVKNVFALFGMLHAIKNAFNAIDHIKVQLTLLSISQNFEQVGISFKLFQKIKYDAVRIPFPNP